MRNIVSWFGAVLLLIVLSGLRGGVLGRLQGWTADRTRDAARWLAAILSLAWWAVAVYRLHMKLPFSWLGADLGTPVQVLTFFSWCLATGYFAPLVAMKVRTFSSTRAT